MANQYLITVDETLVKAWVFISIINGLQEMFRIKIPVMDVYGSEDPVEGCVHVLTDADGRMLFQGLDGMHEVWVRYPWKGETIDCRGAVFACREAVSRTWITDSTWRDGAR